MQTRGRPIKRQRYDYINILELLKNLAGPDKTKKNLFRLEQLASDILMEQHYFFVWFDNHLQGEKAKLVADRAAKLRSMLMSSITSTCRALKLDEKEVGERSKDAFEEKWSKEEQKE